jgi:putative PIN family toxin of toxin-antitoxin system
MRVLIDTNILISHLLSTEPQNTIPTVVNHCITSPEVLLIAPELLLQELRSSCQGKEYLRKKITQEELTAFIDKLSAGSLTPAQEITPPSYSRDPKDDYLVYIALVHHVDFLVTGDEDLLSLRTIRSLKIVSPVEFARLV